MIEYQLLKSLIIFKRQNRIFFEISKNVVETSINLDKTEIFFGDFIGLRCFRFL